MRAEEHQDARKDDNPLLHELSELLRQSLREQAAMRARLEKFEERTTQNMQDLTKRLEKIEESTAQKMQDITKRLDSINSSVYFIMKHQPPSTTNSATHAEKAPHVPKPSPARSPPSLPVLSAAMINPTVSLAPPLVAPSIPPMQSLKSPSKAVQSPASSVASTVAEPIAPQAHEKEVSAPVEHASDHAGAEATPHLHFGSAYDVEENVLAPEQPNSPSARVETHPDSVRVCFLCVCLFVCLFVCLVVSFCADC
jgi:hypothetical protein